MNLYELPGGPIIACSTGNGVPSAVALIRISSPFPIPKLNQVFFAFERGKKIRDFTVRKAHYVKLIGKNKQILDTGILTYFQSPQSYTGENVYEISIHGNPLNVKRVIDFLSVTLGCRHAAPGEFTFRAYKNKKLKLNNVEGLDLLLKAHTPLALEQGIDLLYGDLGRSYQGIHESYVAAKQAVELNIDFVEDVGDQAATKLLRKNIGDLEKSVNSLAKRVLRSDADLLLPKVVLLGEVNAGKSSLFNFLLDKDRSITSSQAGTTRDYISETLSCESFSFELIDTAGIRKTQDEVEALGIERAKERVKKSFFKILVVNPFQGQAILEDFLRNSIKEKIDIVVYTHADRDGFDFARSKVLENFRIETEVVIALGENMTTGEAGPIGPVDSGPIGPLQADSIRKQILDLIQEKYDQMTKHRPIVLERHKDLIQAIHKQMEEVQLEMKAGEDIGVLDHLLKEVGSNIEQLIGVLDSNMVLNSIFDNFCIGK